MDDQNTFFPDTAWVFRLYVISLRQKQWGITEAAAVLPPSSISFASPSLSLSILSSHYMSVFKLFNVQSLFFSFPFFILSFSLFSDSNALDFLLPYFLHGNLRFPLPVSHFFFLHHMFSFFPPMMPNKFSISITFILCLPVWLSLSACAIVSMSFCPFVYASAHHCSNIYENTSLFWASASQSALLSTNLHVSVPISTKMLLCSRRLHLSLSLYDP